MDVHGRTAATPAEVDALLSRPADSAAAPELYEIDHVHAAGSGKASDTTTILYGAVGTQCFAELHAKLVAAASAPGALAATSPLAASLLAWPVPSVSLAARSAL